MRCPIQEIVLDMTAINITVNNVTIYKNVLNDNMVHNLIFMYFQLFSGI